MKQRISLYGCPLGIVILGTVSLAFTIAMLCVILSAVLFFVTVTRQDYQTEQAEPMTVGAFPLRQDWRVQLDGPIYIPLTAWDNKVFVRSRNSLYALSGENGTIIWKHSGLADALPEEIILAQNGLVVARKDPQTLSAFDIQTGEIKFSMPDPAKRGTQIESVAIDHQSIYVVHDSYSLRVYDLENGNMRWVSPVSHGVRRDAFVNTQADEVYIVSPSYVSALNRQTGELSWNAQFVSERTQAPYPNLYDTSRNELLLARDGILYVFNVSSQMVRLDFKTDNLWFYPRQIGDILYTASRNGVIEAFDLASGKSLWRRQIPEASLLQTPNVLGEYLFTQDRPTGRIYAISTSTQGLEGYIQTGQSRTSTHLPEGFNPVVSAGRLIFSQGDRVYGYSP